MKQLICFFLLVKLFLLTTADVSGQKQVAADCFSALEVRVPINIEAFETKWEKEQEQSPTLYYMYQDQFTFWYRIQAEAGGDLNISISPVSERGAFHALVYQYNDTAFCRQLIDGKLKPGELPYEELVDSEDRETEVKTKHYTLRVEKGNAYYLSILSLVPDICGHRIAFRHQKERVAFHAMNKPCFRYSALDHELDTLSTVKDVRPDLEIDYPSSVTVIQDTVVSDNSVAELLKIDTVQRNPEIDDIVSETDKSSAKKVKLVDRVIEKGSKLELNEIYFYNNTYALREGSYPELQQLLALMNKYPDLKIEIGGHTAGNTKNIRPNPNLKDRGKGWGFSGSSKKLSRKRAQAVKEFLVEKGISALRIKTRGYGDTSKIVANPKTPSDHRRNMRVEIAIISR